MLEKWYGDPNCGIRLKLAGRISTSKEGSQVEMQRIKAIEGHTNDLH